MYVVQYLYLYLFFQTIVQFKKKKLNECLICVIIMSFDFNILR